MTDPYSESMRNEWAWALQNLAEEFLHGEAAVAPRDAKVCKECPLPALCRKAELDLVTITDDDTDA